ncbi:MAG: hypothetical protein K6C13_11735 [Oscillospiraceae bacterium]|nr:hypothetical protein [Oscillospiraceae bacterium]
MEQIMTSETISDNTSSIETGSVVILAISRYQPTVNMFDILQTANIQQDCGQTIKEVQSLITSDRHDIVSYSFSCPISNREPSSKDVNQWRAVR